MWPFRRDRRPEGRQPPTTGGPAAVTAPSGEWRRLAPVQRAVPGPALTLRAGGDFRRGLAGPHNPSFVGSLGHHVSALAPSGTVQGLATTIRPSPPAWQLPADLALRERPGVETGVVPNGTAASSGAAAWNGTVALNGTAASNGAVTSNGSVASNGTGPPMTGTLDGSPRRLAAVDAPVRDRPRPIDAPSVEPFRQLAPEPPVQRLPDAVRETEPAPPGPRWSIPDLGAETRNDGDPTDVDPEDLGTPADSGESGPFGDPSEPPGPSHGPAGFGDPSERLAPSQASGPQPTIAPRIQLVTGRGTDRTRAIQRQPEAGPPASTGQPEPRSPAPTNALADLTLRRAGDSVTAQETPDSGLPAADGPVTPTDSQASGAAGDERGSEPADVRVREEQPRLSAEQPLPPEPSAGAAHPTPDVAAGDGAGERLGGAPLSAGDPIRVVRDPLTSPVQRSALDAPAQPVTLPNTGDRTAPIGRSTATDREAVNDRPTINDRPTVNDGAAKSAGETVSAQRTFAQRIPLGPTAGTTAPNGGSGGSPGHGELPLVVASRPDAAFVAPASPPRGRATVRPPTLQRATGVPAATDAPAAVSGTRPRPDPADDPSWETAAGSRPGPESPTDRPAIMGQHAVPHPADGASTGAGAAPVPGQAPLTKPTTPIRAADWTPTALVDHPGNFPLMGAPDGDSAAGATAPPVQRSIDTPLTGDHPAANPTGDVSIETPLAPLTGRQPLPEPPDIRITGITAAPAVDHAGNFPLIQEPEGDAGAIPTAAPPGTEAGATGVPEFHPPERRNAGSGHDPAIATSDDQSTAPGQPTINAPMGPEGSAAVQRTINTLTAPESTAAVQRTINTPVGREGTAPAPPGGLRTTDLSGTPDVHRAGNIPLRQGRTPAVAVATERVPAPLPEEQPLGEQAVDIRIVGTAPSGPLGGSGSLPMARHREPVDRSRSAATTAQVVSRSIESSVAAMGPSPGTDQAIGVESGDGSPMGTSFSPLSAYQSLVREATGGGDARGTRSPATRPRQPLTARAVQRSSDAPDAPDHGPRSPLPATRVRDEQLDPLRPGVVGATPATMAPAVQRSVGLRDGTDEVGLHGEPIGSPVDVRIDAGPGRHPGLPAVTKLSLAGEGARGPSAATRPSVQRAVPGPTPAMHHPGRNLPLAALPAGTAPAFVNAGAVAVEAGIAHWDSDGSVVFDAPADEFTVQREPGPTPAAAPTWAPEEPVVVSSAAPAEPKWPGGLDWEGLVHKLHEEIRWQLRAELRRDAELFGSGPGMP